MTGLESAGAATLAAAGVALLGLAAYVYRAREGPGVVAFAVYLGLLGAAGVGGGVVAASTVVALATLWVVRLAEVAAIAWVAFALAYTGWDDLVTRRSLAALVGLYLLLVAPLAADPLALTLGDGVVQAVRIASDLFGVGLTLLGATLVLETTYRHGVIDTGVGVALGAAAVLPWFLVQVGGFAPGPTPSSALVWLYACGFLGVGLLVALAVLGLGAFDGTAATHTYGRRAVLSGTDDLVVVVDPDGRVVELNEAARRRLGVAGSDARGAELSTVFGEAVAAPEGPRTVELATVDGLRQFDVDRIDLSDGRGRPVGRLLSLRDVTRRRQREQGLDVLNRLLRHNLRNTLNAVQLRTTLVADRLEDPELDEHLAAAEASIDDLVALSEKGRAIERAFGSEPPALTAVDVDDCVASVADAVRGAFPDAEVRTHGDGAVVTTHGPLLRLALENVVENAVEHSDAATPRAVVSYEGDEGGVAVTVEDNGPGIPDAEVAAIRQGHETPTVHASGVGLWLVSWAVTTCGGTVAFGDGEDGARVELWVPDRDADARPEPAPGP